MSTTSDYVGRTFDLVAWQGIAAPAPTGRIVALDPSLASPGAGGMILTGIAKLAQRATMLLLTERGSLRYARDVGTLFVTEARAGRWRTPLDVQQAFYASLVDISRQLNRLVVAADPADERYAGAELLSVGLAGDRVEIGVRWDSEAGTAYTVVAPINTVVK